MRNAHFVVINDRRKVVGGEKIRFEQDRIGRKGCVCVTQGTKNQVRLWSGAHREDRVLRRRHRSNVSG